MSLLVFTSYRLLYTTLGDVSDITVGLHLILTLYTTLGDVTDDVIACVHLIKTLYTCLGGISGLSACSFATDSLHYSWSCQ